jgi:tetratricopeptide (TPR) repeat protein/energy-coupling factor transporter ATP-binding protein EcfA2
MFNPFPGLRPFEPDEDHLFFGRETQIDELLRRLRAGRFLTIVGTSGSGKSSLVRSGLIPALDGGFMVQTSPTWRVAIMRPGGDPTRNLAAALNSLEMLGAAGELEETNTVLLEATLRRGTRGLVEAVRHARLPATDNLLIVVDQFEELFRFRRDPQNVNSRDEAISFVKLLLEASRHEELPIYVVITMRSDFIGDCMDYPGLPEAVNSGQYLVPRMIRDELRSAITGPVAVGGGTITQRLVLRLLNDCGDDYDQLPILQHALMRTWDFWEHKGNTWESIDIEDYEAIGTVKHALSLHAEEAYEETGSDVSKAVTQKIFKALTDTFSDARGTRRPTSIGDLMQICEARQEEIVRIVEIFRRPGRTFLMPPRNVPLEDFCIVDLSHESFMRCWTRLVGWAEEERSSAEIYHRLSDAEGWFRQGRAGLWRNPELEFAKKWSLDNRPTAAWAQRYNSNYTEVIGFLSESEADWQREKTEKQRERQKKLRQTQWVAGILGSLFLITLFLAFYALQQYRRAQSNLRMAKEAVDQSLSSAGREQAREGSDLPQMERFRGELLDKAENFYTILAGQNTSNPSFQVDEARAHSRLGDINRLLGNTQKAVQQYTDAINRFSQLADDNPANPEFKQALGYCHNWLGEAIRQAVENNASSGLYSPSQAEKEYSEAIDLQERLHNSDQANAIYQQELARTYYNRGIVRFDIHETDTARSDLSKSILLLEPLVAKARTPEPDSTTPDPAQDLARVYNDYAIVLGHAGKHDETETYYEKAIQLLEEQVRKDPSNREYKAELAQYDENEARMLVDTNKQQLAELRSQRALELLNELAAPSSTLSIKRAQALELRSQLLETQKPNDALVFADQAYAILQQIDQGPGTKDRYSALYMNIAANYLEIAQNYLRMNDRTSASRVLASFTEVVPHLSQDDRTTFDPLYQKLQRELLRPRALQ